MDQTSKQTYSQEETQQKTNYARPKRMAWIKKTNRRLRALRCAMVGICGMIFVVGMLLLILPAFKVKDIVVEGDLVATTAEEIIEASGIAYGTEIIGTDWKVAASNIEKQCHVKVDSLEITPFKVKIRVTELETVRMQCGEYWVSLDENFKVMDVSREKDAFAGLIQVKLPAVSSVSKGEKLCFTSGETDLAYVRTVLQFLEDREMTSRVDVLDASEKFNVVCTLDGTYRVVLGKASDLDTKMEIANEIISLKNGEHSYAVIDVSDVKRSTYRPVEQPELLLANR